MRRPRSKPCPTRSIFRSEISSSAAARAKAPVSATLANTAQASKSGSRGMVTFPETICFHRFYFAMPEKVYLFIQRDEAPGGAFGPQGDDHDRSSTVFEPR